MRCWPPKATLLIDPPPVRPPSVAVEAETGTLGRSADRGCHQLGNVASADSLNPVAGVIDGLKWELVSGRAPGLPLLVSAGIVTPLMITGLFSVNHVGRHFAGVSGAMSCAR